MNKTWAKRSAQAGALAAGVLLFTAGVAQADGPDMVSAGNQGIANGNQLLIPIQVPIDICGNGIAVAGVAGAGCQGGSDANIGDEESGHVTEGGLGDMASAGNSGILNGNQAQVPVQVPIDVCGNAIGALVGIAGAGCQGGSDANIGDEESGHVTEGGLGDMASAGNSGILNGNQAQVPVQVPIDVCGNAIGALVGIAGAGCQGGSDANIGDEESGHVTEGGTLGDMVSAGNNGILNGNQLQAPIQVPIDICGNAIAVLGVAGAGCQGGADANIGDEESGSITEDGADMSSGNGVTPSTNVGGLPIDQLTSQLPGGDTVGSLTSGLASANLPIAK